MKGQSREATYRYVISSSPSTPNRLMRGKEGVWKTPIFKDKQKTIDTT